VLKSKEPTRKPFPNDPQDVSLRNGWNRPRVDSVAVFILWTGAMSIFSTSEYFLLQNPLKIKIIIVTFPQSTMMIHENLFMTILKDINLRAKCTIGV
jgi:hypothetical protein